MTISKTHSSRMLETLGMKQRTFNSFTVLYVMVCAYFSRIVHAQNSNASLALTPQSIHREIFLEQLIHTYSSKDGLIYVDQLDKLIRNIRGTDLNSTNEEHLTLALGSESGSDSSGEGVAAYTRNLTGRCADLNDSSDATKCWTSKCLSAEDIFRFHAFPDGSGVSASQFADMLPSVVYQLQSQRCHLSTSVTVVRNKPLPHEVWGYSFLCVTLINLCALTGVLFLPLMKKSFYQRLLMFMVALAVGTLVGSGLLFLIPDAFELSEETTHLYIFKATTITAGIYLFFLLERIMKIIAEWRKLNIIFDVAPYSVCTYYTEFRKRASNGEDGVDINDVPVYSVIGKTTIDSDPNFKMTFKVPEHARHSHGGHSHSHMLPVSESNTKLVRANGTPQDANGHEGTDTGEASNGDLVVAPKTETTPPIPNKTAIKSVAWMVIFGDGVHNFIDGLSIGAAFTIDTMTGMSVAIAVICEELPHELGDFAILLNSGMSMRQALCYNFLSACMCYLGLAFGILAGESSAGATWIFALAGGMFLYISLVDMLPEVNHAAEEEAKDLISQLKLLFVQNVGMLSGFGIMLIFAIYGEKIRF